MGNHHTLRGVAIGLVVGVTISTGAAFATIPSTNGNTISGCYAKSSGALRAIDAESGQTCSRNDLPLTWNVRGVPGPKGDSGLPDVYVGRQNPAVIDIPSGATHVRIVTL
jgi:hypothetical protein